MYARILSLFFFSWSTYSYLSLDLHLLNSWHRFKGPINGQMACRELNQNYFLGLSWAWGVGRNRTESLVMKPHQLSWVIGNSTCKQYADEGVGYNQKAFTQILSWFLLGSVPWMLFAWKENSSIGFSCHFFPQGIWKTLFWRTKSRLEPQWRKALKYSVLHQPQSELCYP